MSDERTFDAVTAELGLSIEDETITNASTYVEKLEGYLQRWKNGREPVSSRGSWADDEYNALLDLYEEPRKKTDEGPLAGMTFAVKDNIAVEGLRMTLGSTSIETVPSNDATVVRRILNAGGQIVGKANMDAFAFGPGGIWSERGTVRNPLDSDRIPGGSSSGSGVAIAADIVDASLGSDTGGSIRSPAACCGVVGIKPTHSHVSRYGLVQNAPIADTIGPLAKDVETAARILEVIRGPDPHDPSIGSVDSEPLHRGIDQFGSAQIGILNLEPHDVSETVTEAMADLASALDSREDITVIPIELELESVGEAYTIITGTEYSWLLRQSHTHRGGVPPHPDLTNLFTGNAVNEHIAERILPGAYLDKETNGQAYALARDHVAMFKRKLEDCFDSVDILLTPTLRTVPPKPAQLRSDSGGFKYTIAKQFGVAGLPAVSVPFTERKGLPVSAQVLAPHFEERKAISAARLIERLQL